MLACVDYALFSAMGGRWWGGRWVGDGDGDDGEGRGGEGGCEGMGRKMGMCGGGIVEGEGIGGCNWGWA